MAPRPVPFDQGHLPLGAAQGRTRPLYADLALLQRSLPGLRTRLVPEADDKSGPISGSRQPLTPGHIGGSRHQQGHCKEATGVTRPPLDEEPERGTGLQNVRLETILVLRNRPVRTALDLWYRRLA